MTYPVRTTRRGRVLEITLDRPKANAIDAATSRAMGAAFQTLADDDTLSV
ncbi:MAG: carnitinyl-CoA dehydratase, partial [Pseudomonadota bacterium]